MWRHFVWPEGGIAVEMTSVVMVGLRRRFLAIGVKGHTLAATSL